MMFDYILIVWISCCVVFRTVYSGAQRKGILRYNLDEETYPGTVVGDVRLDSRLAEQYPYIIFQSLEFSILDQTVELFRIGRYSGLLQTNVTVDREAIPQCIQKRLCTVTLDVAIQPVAYFQVIRIEVEIQDLNDHAPVFPERELTHPLLESADVGSSFLLPTASDLDSPALGVLGYDMERPSNAFGLKVEENLDGEFTVRITLRARLDREKVNGYQLIVTAYDGGIPSRTGNVTVWIPVEDSNDHTPVFTRDSYSVSVPEDVEPGSSILRVSAADGDIGENGQVVYGMSSYSRLLYGQLVSVDNSTGDIVVLQELDREHIDMINVIVTAWDLGPGSVSSDASVSIHLEDVNDNAPIITITTLLDHAPGRTSVPEDAAKGTFVAYATVYDLDLGDNGTFSCTLSDLSFRLDPLSDSEFQIITARFLDREAVSQFNLDMVCRDRGSPPRVSLSQLTVDIEDVNDHSPIFSDRTYLATVQENPAPNIWITQVTARDRDTGPNGEIRYSLDQSSTDMFAIGPISGVIQTKAPLDRESQEQYRFQVVARDHGIPPSSDTAQVVVTVTDANDERPEFLRSGYTFYVTENNPVGAKVGTVRAVDRDGPPYNRVLYTVMRSTFARPSPFFLSARAGRLIATSRLDRESQSAYEFVIRALDADSPLLYATATVTVYVVDENDNSPVFEFPSPANNTVVIPRNVPAGFQIAKVQATDLDDGRNARLSYSITGGNGLGGFTLQQDSGVLTVTRPLPASQYTLQLRAVDHGSPALSQAAQLTVLVNASLEYHNQTSLPINRVLHYNIVVITSMACGACVVTLSIIVGVLIARRHGNRDPRVQYKCRMETRHVICSREHVTGPLEEVIPMVNGPKMSDLTI